MQSAFTNPGEPISQAVKAEAKTELPSKAGLRARLCLIAALMAVVGLVAIPVVVYSGWVSLNLAVLAWVVCVISSLCAHVAGEYPSGDEFFAARLGLSMGARTAPPFLLVIAVKALPSLTFKPGFVVLVVLFYLVGLLADVFIQTKRLKSTE